MIRENKVKKKIKRHEPVIGSFVKSFDPSSVEIFGLAGFDFFVLDNEHVAMDKEQVTNIIRASDITGIVPIIRIRENTAVEILQALDSGALGVQIPNVNTFEGAKSAVENSRYCPYGNRGYAPTHRAAGYGLMDKFEYIKMANDEVMTVIHCESLEAVKNLDLMLTIENLDVVFIGPSDLSHSMGTDVMGKSNHPMLLQTIEEIIVKVVRSGKSVGIPVSSMEQIHEFITKGVTYITISSDFGMICDQSKKIIDNFAKLIRS